MSSAEAATGRRQAAAAWAFAGFALISTMAGVVATASRESPAATFGYAVWNGSFLAYPLVGALIVARRPRHRIGALLVAIGVSFCLTVPLEQVGRVLVESGGWHDAGRVALWLSQTMWVPGGVLLLVFLPLLFPDGHPPSPRWRVVAHLGAVVLVVATVPRAILAWPHRGLALVTADNVAELFEPGLLATLDAVSFPAMMLLAVAAFASVVVRYSRTSGTERLQLKWVTFGVAVTVVSVLASAPLPSGGAFGFVGPVLNGVASGAVPVAVGVSILRHRLYGIDVVLSKTLVFSGLAAFITSVYVAVVSAAGLLLGSDESVGQGASVLATAIVAVAFQSVRERLTHVANRMVYGRRATPYEVLSGLAQRLRDAVATGEVLTRMAHLLADSTGGTAFVHLRVGGEWTIGARAPEDGTDEPQVALDDGGRLVASGTDIAVAVEHQGEVLGALSVRKGRGDVIDETEAALVRDVAAQAGLALRNVALQQDLLRHVDELRASRQRLVAVQDQERRRLERDLHDGAQQQLVSLKIKLNLAKMIAEESGDVADELGSLLDELVEDTTNAVQNLRELAHGIYPPLLAANGLAQALAARGTNVPFDVHIEADGLGRYPQAVEAAVYFCVLEALQNVAKYANARTAVVRLSARNSELRFEVTDDGSGFDGGNVRYGQGLTNMLDRLEALGGSLQVRSAPGAGTTVEGSVPIEQEAVAPPLATPG